MNRPNLKSITLRDFSLMKDGSPIYYAESFGVKDYGFGKVLIPMNYGGLYVDDDTATLTKYAGNGFTGASGIDTLDEDSTRFLYFIDTLSNIWCVSELTKTGQKLYNTNESCSYPDLKATGVGTNSSIIYSTKDKVGRIHRGNATGGSTTTLGDTSVDFTTMGLTAGDYVYNIKDNKLFTIDGGGIAANVLTITAVSGGDFASGDNYAIVDPNWQSLTDNDYTYGRQIIEFDEDFYILNGDALAQATSALAYTAEYKTLESGWIARCGASNGDTIAIGANKNNQGKIFTWDKNGTGWNKKISLKDEIQSIIAWGNNYIYVTGNGIWITDGYSTRRLAKFPDVIDRSAVSMHPKGMAIVENNLVLNIGGGLLSRNNNGLWIFDLEKEEFTYSPFTPDASNGKAGYECSSGIVFFDSWLNYLFYTFTPDSYGWTNAYIMSYLWLDSYYNDGVIITNPINLGKNATIKKIEVSLMNNLFEYTNNASPSYTIDCKLSNCERPLWNYQQASADSTELNKITVYGATAANANAQVGDEVFIRNGWNGYRRRVITAISGDGTASEEWTLDASLVNLIKQNTTLSVLPFQRYDMTPITKTTHEANILEFYPSFYGDNVMLELIITGTSTYPTPAIKEITIYYE